MFYYKITKVVCAHETLSVEGYLTLTLKNPCLISERQPEVLKVPDSSHALPEILSPLRDTLKRCLYPLSPELLVIRAIKYCSCQERLKTVESFQTCTNSYPGPRSIVRTWN